jgi:hypothetical protein
MSIPLDRLYHYIETLSQEVYDNPVIIYRFWPHGSKNLEDLLPLRILKNWSDRRLCPRIYAHDQEPLNYDLYSTPASVTNDADAELMELYPELYNWNNLNRYTKIIFEKSILIHSEINSIEVEKYQNDNFIPVYYWAHALIARDWYRYAEHQSFRKNIQKKFLIYNRSWSGTREYRLKFTELLIKHHLIDQCITNCNPIDPQAGVHYLEYKFTNPAWKPDIVLEDHVATTQAPSFASADFDIDDYNSSEIEVVLETLFEGTRLHLTEKILRPIACGQPFLLAALPGSLKYLQSYGFKTFDCVWDETYDGIQDPESRLSAIVCVMQDILQWDQKIYSDKIAQIQSITAHNQQHFFSEEFFNLITDELRLNLASAFKELMNTDNTDWIKNLIDRWENQYSLCKKHKIHSADWDRYLPELLEKLKNIYESKIQDRTMVASQSGPGVCSL